MSGEEQEAFGLYSGSFNNGGNADSRYMLLFMALETLISRQKRPDDVQAHVNTLIEATKAAKLDATVQESLQGALRDLKLESISQAGQRLAATLGDRQYMNEPDEPEDPVTFFKRCYSLRNKLAHGKYPRPSREVVDRRAAALEVFMADLLAGPLLGIDPRAGLN